jgi:hypothetical protein
MFLIPHLRIPAARLRPGDANERRPFKKKRAQGMPGVQAAPAALCANKESTQAKSLQAKPNRRHSLHDGVNGCFALFPVSMTF